MATVQQSQPTAMEVKISSSGSSGSRPLHVISPSVTPGSTPVEQARSTTVIVQASSSSSGVQSPSKPIPAPLQLNSPSSPAPSNVVLIRPAPVLSPTSRSAPGGGFFIHTGSVSNGPSAVSTTTTPQPVAGNSITIQPQQRQPVVLQQNPVVDTAPSAAVNSQSPGARSSFNIVPSLAAPAPAAPSAAPVPAAQTLQTVVTAPLLPHEHITTLVKTADVPRPVADVVDAVIRAPPAKSTVEKKGPPPMTPRELLATAEPMWVCGFALAVMAVAFVAMANEGEIPISYILSGVVFASLAAFVKLRL